MKRIAFQDLKEYFPEQDADALVEQAKEEGMEVYDIPEKTETETTEEPKADAKEETVEETEQEIEDEVVDEKTKKGLIAARQKEKEKRRAIEAEKNAEIEKLKAQIEEMNKRTYAPQQPQVQTQQQATPEIKSYYDELLDIASERARKEAGLPKEMTDEELSTLQFTEPRKYQKYVLAMNTIASDMHREHAEYAKSMQMNQEFVREVNADPMAQAIYKFADDMLDEKPRRETKAIESALAALNNNRASKEQIEILRTYWGEAKDKFYEASGRQQARPAQQQVQRPSASKLDALTSAPRSESVKTGGNNPISEAELLRMFDEDPIGALDRLPKATLDRYRRG